MVPRILEEGITEQAAKELLDKALVYINPALGEECFHVVRRTCSTVAGGGYH